MYLYKFQAQIFLIASNLDKLCEENDFANSWWLLWLLRLLRLIWLLWYDDDDYGDDGDDVCANQQNIIEMME